MFIKAGNIKKGTYVLHKGVPHYVTKTQFVSPGKGSAFARTRLRDVSTGSTVEFVFKSHDSIEEIDVESRELQFLYNDGTNVVFMDPRSFDQVEVPVAMIEDRVGYLVPELKVYVIFYQDKPIGVTIPLKVKMKVTEAEDAVAGDRQTAGRKPVTMETGLVVQAPLFIKKGETLIVDTETGDYVSRAN
ncbi:MAG: elongation factor P [Patescibacteria group bacterium]